MIFFVANDGTVMESVPSPVYQGSANANDIYLVAPFASNLQATVAFKLPNGVLTEQYAMKLFGELKGVINKQTGKPYSGWRFSMPNEITRYYGVVTAQFYFYTAESTGVIATSSVMFTVGRGVPELLPNAPSSDVYETILSNLSALQQQLDNGTFTARAIYAWNSTYTYGAGELVFYPQKGEYGVFLKSLTDNNKAEPYVNGVLDTANWLLVSDFNILTELYTLKGDILDAVQETRDNVAATAQSASAAGTAAQNASESEEQAKAYVEEATEKAKEAQSWAEIAQHYAQFGIKLNTDYQSVEELPKEGSPQYIYLIPNGSAGNNSYDEYMWIADKSAYEKIGTTDIDLTSYATKAEVAEKEKTLQSDIDQLYGTTERLQISDSLIHARISEVDEFAETKLAEETAARESADQQLDERITAEQTARKHEENKNLYNLGAYDTLSSNGDGTVTITRKTGYIDSTALIVLGWEYEEIGTNKRFKSTLTVKGANPNPDDTIYNNLGLGKFNFSSAEGNGISFYTDGVLYVSYHEYDGDLSAFLTNVISKLALEYQLASEYQYTETVIENQPIHTLPQNGEQWLREEWEKGLNLSIVEYTQNVSRYSPAYVFNVGALQVGGVYTICLKTRDTGAQLYANENVFSEHPVVLADGTNHVLTLTCIGNTEAILFKNNKDNNGQMGANGNAFYDIAIYEGSHPYPYQPYNGGIVREGGATMTGELTVPGLQISKQSAIEMGTEAATPHIDFHYNNDPADYTARIIEDKKGVVNILPIIQENGVRVYSPNNPPPIASSYGNGYIRFTNGLQICWGVTDAPNNTNRDVNFPLLFNSTPALTLCKSRQLGWSASWFSERYPLFPMQIDSAHFRVRFTDTDGSTLFFYIAVGTWK